MHKLLLFLGILFLTANTCLKAQISGPEQDCENAILVCEETYVHNQYYAGIGRVDDIGRGTACFTAFGEQNSVWYRVEVQSDGELSFDLASFMGDDYDFAVYNTTGLSCSDLYDGTGLVRCSFARNTDTTGLRPGYTDTTMVAGSNQANTFLKPIDVKAGESYTILIGYFDVFTQPLPSGGFSLDFRPSTAGLIDRTPAQISQITESGTCSSIDSIRVKLNSRVLCSTIASDGSDFNVVGASTILVHQAMGINCNERGETTEVLVLTSSSTLLTGNHDLFIQQGSDGNTLVDACGNQSPVQSIAFPVDVLDAEFIYSVNSSCSADTFHFEYTGQSSPLSFQWVLNGDTITQPDFYYVFPDTGFYEVELSTFSNDCIVQEYETVRARNIHVSAFFAPTRVCVNDDVQFSDATRGAPNAWEWTFEAGATSNLQNPTYSYSQAGEYTVELVAIENSILGICIDTFRSNISVVAEPVLSFQSPEEVCQEEPFGIQFTGTGILETIQWLINGDTLSGVNQEISLTEIGTTNIQLLFTDSVCGFFELEKDVLVNETPFFNLGNDTLICPDEELVLRAFSGADRTYWSTGEEIVEEIIIDSFDREISVNVRLADCYYRDTIFVGNKIEGCFMIIVPSAFTPNGDGLNDYLKVIPVKLSDWTISIFNRWGELVFQEENNLYGGWDGTYKGYNVEVGVYTYFVKGHTLLGDKVDQTGNITLLR